MPSTRVENSRTLSLNVNRLSRDVGIICGYGISIGSNLRIQERLFTNCKTRRLFVSDPGRRKHEGMTVGVENGNSFVDPDLGQFHFTTTPICVECNEKVFARGVLHKEVQSNSGDDVDDLAQEAPVASRHVSNSHVPVESEVQEVLLGEPGKSRERAQIAKVGERSGSTLFLLAVSGTCIDDLLALHRLNDLILGLLVLVLILFLIPLPLLVLPVLFLLLRSLGLVGEFGLARPCSFLRLLVPAPEPVLECGFVQVPRTSSTEVVHSSYLGRETVNLGFDALSLARMKKGESSPARAFHSQPARCQKTLDRARSP